MSNLTNAEKHKIAQDIERQEIWNHNIKVRKILNKWQKFVSNKNVEFWSKEDFLELIENEDIILTYTWEQFDSKMHVVKTNKPNQVVVDLMARLKELYKERFTNHTQETTPPGPEIDFDVDAALKICLLHELGVVDLLRVKGFGSNNKMAQLIAFLTKEPIKTGAANVTLGRIQNDGLVDKYQSELAALKLKFGIK